MTAKSEGPFVCFMCGIQFPLSSKEPSSCPICDDDRQCLSPEGQKWTTHKQLLQDGHKNLLKEEEPCVLGIGTEPAFANGNRALLIQTGEGNMLWDCITVLDDDTRAHIRSLGGIRAIAVSHPHFYTRMADWAEEFDAIVYVHAADKQFIVTPSERISYWTGERMELFGGATLLRLGGHFPGSAVLHWAPGASGRGLLCSGAPLHVSIKSAEPPADTIQTVPRPGYVSFMYSYPNYLPLPPEEVERIKRTVGGWDLDFDKILGGWYGRVVPSGGKAAVLSSADRIVGLLRNTSKRHWNS